jgi:hypothetical protein
MKAGCSVGQNLLQKLVESWKEKYWAVGAIRNLAMVTYWQEL